MGGRFFVCPIIRGKFCRGKTGLLAGGCGGVHAASHVYGGVRAAFYVCGGCGGVRPTQGWQGGHNNRRRHYVVVDRLSRKETSLSTAGMGEGYMPHSMYAEQCEGCGGIHAASHACGDEGACGGIRGIIFI